MTRSPSPSAWATWRRRPPSPPGPPPGWWPRTPPQTATSATPWTASDDDGDALSYSLAGAGAALFAIDASSGQIETKAPLDFETGPNTYSLTVRVSDRMNAGGAPVAGTVPDIDDSIAVTITVTNVNEAPTLSGRERINAREIATVEITTYEAVDPEHDDLTWSLSGTDSDDFTISSSGALAFSSLPDFERPTDFGRNNVYQFTLQVSDAKSATGDPDPAIDATLDVTVTVTNVGEVGEITVSPGPARVGVGLTASLSDPDGGVTNLTWQWQISANGASWSDIAGATSARYTPPRRRRGQVSCASAAAYSDDQARATTAEATLAGAVQSAPNTPPRFRASSTSRSRAREHRRGAGHRRARDRQRRAMATRSATASAAPTPPPSPSSRAAANCRRSERTRLRDPQERTPSPSPSATARTPTATPTAAPTTASPSPSA